MKTSKKILLLLAMLITSWGMAQQMPNHSFQFFNREFENPSTIGIGDQINASIIYKSYLTGFSGGPKTIFGQLNGPAIKDKLGVGFNIYSDRTGIANRIGAYGAVAYSIKFKQEHRLNFGLSLGVLTASINQDEIEVDNTDDPFLLNKKFSSSTIDGNFGISYRFKGLKVGFAIDQLFATGTSFTEDLSFNLERSYVGSISYQVYLNSSKTMSLQPMIVGRYAKSSMPHDIYLTYNFKDMLFVTPSYKTSGALGGSVAVNVFNGFKVGYSYETIVKQPVSGNQNGGHEIMLGYSFDIRSKSQRKFQNQIDELNEKLDQYQENQMEKDRLQDDLINKQQEGIEINKEGIDLNKQKIDDLDGNLKETQKELEELQKELKEAGLIKEESITDYDGAVKGYYLVIASVKDSRINEDHMQRDFISKGYKRVYNKKTGWHYVYTVRFDEFAPALKELKKLRSGEFDDAWIHILK